MGLLIISADKQVTIFNNPYSAFGYLREAVGNAFDIPLWNIIWDEYGCVPSYLVSDEVLALKDNWELLPLYYLLKHADDSGFWTPTECDLIANFLRKNKEKTYAFLPSGQHQYYWYIEILDDMIKGLDYCAKNKQNAVFT